MKALKEFINEGNFNLNEIASITYKVETQIDYDVKKSDDKGATIFFDVNLYVTSGKNNPHNYGKPTFDEEDIDHTYRIKVDLKYHEINEGQLNVFLVDDANVTLDKGNNFKKDLDFIYNLFHGSKNINLAWYIDHRINHLIMHEISTLNSRLPIWIPEEINKKITKQFDNLFEV